MKAIEYFCLFIRLYYNERTGKYFKKIFDSIKQK